MNDVYVTFRSVTSAMGARRALERGAIKAFLIRTPEALRVHGCGYSLRLARRQMAAAHMQLEKESIPYQRLFQKDEKGHWQEVVL